MKNMHDVYGRNLDLNLLRVFALVAEEGSVTRAASRLYITQPAVSAAMRRLTSFVGAELFARQGGGLVLTHRGTELLASVRVHLQPLVAATLAAPAFEPRTSTAIVRLGLNDAMETLLLPTLLRLLGTEAPDMQLVVVPAQFRVVEELILSRKIDVAVCVADELPRSILRQPLITRPLASGDFSCLYDSRFARLSDPLTEQDYFAHEHVVVSYAGDLRGIVEDALGRSRRVRVSVPLFSHVAEVVEGSPLLATIPSLLAWHLVRRRPHLRSLSLPFSLDGTILELLWSRITDDDPVMRFVRGLLTTAARSLEADAAGFERARASGDAGARVAPKRKRGRTSSSRR